MPYMNNRRVIIPVFITILLLASVFQAPADFNRTLDSILSEEYLTYGGASFMLLAGTGIIDDNSTLDAAAAKMSELYPATSSSWNEYVTLGKFSYMTMLTYGIEGGLFYRILPGSRYALRELRFKRIVQGRAFSTMYLSGERAFRILGRVLDREEERYAQN